MASKGEDRSKNEHGLTPKQEAFVQALIETRNQSEAYRRAYNVGENTSENTVRWEAWELMQNPNVTQRIADIQAQIASSVFYTAADAFEELEEARNLANSVAAPAAAVSAVKGKMELLGMGSKNLKINAEIIEAPLGEEEQLERIKSLIPQIAPILVALGWTPPEESDDEGE